MKSDPVKIHLFSPFSRRNLNQILSTTSSSDEASIYLSACAAFSQLMTREPSLSPREVRLFIHETLYKDVIERVRIKHKAHPVLLLEPEDQNSSPQGDGGKCDRWNRRDCEVILDCMNVVLFKVHGFKGSEY